MASPPSDGSDDAAEGSTVQQKPRSSQPGVRNPVLLLTAFQRLQALPPESKAALIDVLADLDEHATELAQKCWAKGKGPMALYWKVVGVYARHIKHALKHEERKAA